MKKGVCWIIVGFLLCYCVSALPEINITPLNPIIDILQGNTGTFSLNITNFGDIDLYNLTFTSITSFGFPQNIAIAKNTSIIVNYTVYGQTGISNPTTTVSFYYNVTTTVTPMTHYITISSAGFSTANKTVYIGDTINFKNTDTLNHTITLTDMSYDKILQPNEDINITLFSEGTKTYYDRVTLLGMYITILNNIVSTPAHDPSLDKTMVFTYNLLYNKAQIIIENILPSGFSIDYRSSAEGAIQIKANDTAYHIWLYDEWFNFEEQDFNLQKNISKIVKFTLKPQIEKYTNNTNMTHYRNIKITSSNSDGINQTVPVFIEYYNFDLLSSNGTAIYTNYIIVNWTEAVVFCSKNPDQYFCNGFPTITKEVPAQVKFNLSETDFMNYLQNVKDNSDRMQRIENNLIEYEANTNTKFTDYQIELIKIQGDMNNQTMQIQQLIDIWQQYRQQEEDEDTLKYFIFFVICIIITIIIGGYYFFNKNIMDKRIYR